jgi:hypothetical protein
LVPCGARERVDPLRARACRLEVEARCVRLGVQSIARDRHWMLQAPGRRRESLLRLVHELHEPRGQRAPDVRVVSVGLFERSQHLLGGDVTGRCRDWCDEGSGRDAAVAGKGFLHFVNRIEIGAVKPRPVHLEDDVPCVVEVHPVHASATRTEEPILRDARAEVRATPLVDRRLERVRVVGSEDGALEWKVCHGPLGALSSDGVAEAAHAPILANCRE